MATADNTVNGAAYDRFYGSDNNIPWPDLPAYCAAIDGGDEIFARRLRSHWWPAVARSSVAAMVSDLAALSGLEYNCASAPGTSSGQQDLQTQIKTAEDKLNNDASAVRVALGLPVKR